MPEARGTEYCGGNGRSGWLVARSSRVVMMLGDADALLNAREVNSVAVVAPRASARSSAACFGNVECRAGSVSFGPWRGA